MVSREQIEQRLENARKLREDYAATVYRLEGTIVALEELLTIPDGEAPGLSIVQTDDGPAIDLTGIVELDKERA